MKIQKEYNTLETHFKHLADAQEFEYQAADWSALEERLDKDESNKTPFFIFLLIVLLGVTASITWFWVSDSGSQNVNTTAPLSQNINVNEIPSSDVIALNTTAELSAEQETIKTKSSKTVDFAGTATDELSNENKSRKEDQKVSLNEHQNNLEVKSSISQLELEKVNKNIKETKVENQNEPRFIGINKLVSSDLENRSQTKKVYEETLETISSGDHISSDIDQNSVIKRSTSNLEQNNKENQIAINNRSILNSKLDIAYLIKDILPLTTGNVDEHVALPNHMGIDSSYIDVPTRPRFLINLNAGVEISQTPRGRISDTDFSFGVKLGYIASSRLILTAGANYINECYAAETQDYRPPKGFWRSTEGRAPNAILAVCDMIDISMGASYHFKDVQSNGLAAHLNLNSNIMLREEYNYRFANSNDDWIGIFERESSTLLSSIELATTYKLNIGNRNFIDAGPYIKIPTNGIGHGKVMLSAFGFRMGISIMK